MKRFSFVTGKVAGTGESHSTGTVFFWRGDDHTFVLDQGALTTFDENINSHVLVVFYGNEKERKVVAVLDVDAINEVRKALLMDVGACILHLEQISTGKKYFCPVTL